MRKLSLVSLVPFISSRIHTGVMPRPDHFSDLSFFDWYFGFAFARLPALAVAGRDGFHRRRRLLRDVAAELRKLVLEIGALLADLLGRARFEDLSM